MQFNKKKIVFVITDFGSFNNFLGDTAVSLARLGNEVHLISSAIKVINIDDKFDYKNEGVLIHYVDLPRGFNPIRHYFASKKIHSIIENIMPDVVSIHFTTGIFTTTFKSRLKFRTIGTIHGLGYPVVDGILKKIIFKFVERRSLKRIDEAWVLNNVDLELIKKDFPKIPVFIIPTKGLGCDLEKFNTLSFSDESNSKLKASLGIKENDFVLCFTGRFVRFKGYDKVVRAFRILIEDRKITNVKLMLIGGKDQAHPTGLNDEEEAWVNEVDEVINIGFTTNVQDYLSITDLFIFPSEKEGMPVCIIEALAMNTPVITANARGCNDLISNEVNGILLSENTSEEIANQVLLLKSNKLLYSSLTDNIAKERATMDRNLFVKQQVDFFNGIELKIK